MSYNANRNPVAGSNSGGSGDQSPYQSVETSPSHSRSTSFESFQTAVLRNNRPVSNLPNSSSTTHDLTSMHHDPCIKVIQTSPSSVSLDKFAAHMAHSNSYSSLPPVPSSLAEFQSLPANIQHHHQSTSQCKTSTSMSAALAAARPLVHNVQDLESSFTSIPAAVSGPTTVKSLIDNAVDEQMRQYQLQQQKIQSSASSAMSFIDEILSNIKPATTETKQSESSEERTPYKATSESATQQASVRSPDMLNKPAQSNLSAPNMSYHHVNTLSPNGSTINDAVAIFNLANATSSSSSSSSNKTYEINKTPSKATSEPVSVSSDSKVVKSLEMPSSVEPVATLKSSESTELTKLAEEEKKKDSATMPSSTPASPSAKKEKDQNKSRNKTDKVKKDDKKDEKKDKSLLEKKKDNNVSVASSVKSESKKTEKKEKKENKKLNKENKESKDGKKENVKENKIDEKKHQTVKTEASATSSPVVPLKDSAPKPQREKPAKKPNKSSQKSKGANTTTESQQLTSKSSKSTTESKDSDKRSAKKKTETSHEKQVVDESNKSDQLIQMLLAKLEKMNCSKSSGHKQSTLINRLKYQPDLLKRIRDERHEFIEAIWPDIFKAYSYCMDGRHWNPEHYFDIVQSGGDYEKIHNVHGKKSLNKPVSAPAYQQNHQNNQYNHSTMGHQPSQYYKNNMNNKRKFYDNNYHGGQYQSHHNHQYQPNRQYHPYNHNQQYVDNHSPEMPQVPRNSPKAYSDTQEKPPQHLEMGNARPEQHILNMLGLKKEEDERVDSRLMNLLNRPAVQTSHNAIENLLLAPKEPATKSKILTAHELEMMQLKESQRSTSTYGLGDAMSDALRQLVKNLDNHPLSGANVMKPQPSVLDSQMLKQMLRIPSDERMNKFPSSNPSEMPLFQQAENLLLASVNARQAKEKEHFQSLVLNKLMPSTPVDNIMKWFPQ